MRLPLDLSPDDLLARLPAPARALLARAAAAAGDTPLWLVGGAVRDLLLDRPVGRDLDLATEGDVAALAPALCAALPGQLLASHAAFGTATIAADDALVDLARARVERYPRPAALPEVAPAPMAADLIRRDFSVNAIAVELGLARGELRGGAILDPFDGRGDLAAGRLRLLHPLSLRDDPTRILRGLRLAARLGLELEPASRAQLDEALGAGYLAMLTHERALAELCLALDEPRPDELLRLADGWGVSAQVTPGLAWDMDLAARCARFLAAEPGGHPVALADDDRRLVWLGLLAYSPAAAAGLAARYRLPGAPARLLREAGALRALAPRLSEPLAPSAVDRLLRPFHAASICVLHYAEPSAAAATARYLRELRPAAAPLDGNDLRRMGVAPGPGLGRLLDELRAAWLDGQIATPSEAEAWVRRHAGDKAQGE